MVALGHWGGKVIPLIKIETPMPLTFPVKILANIGALMLLCGLALLTARRLRLNPDYQGSSFYDWYLLGIIWLVAVTGVLSQCFRLADAIRPAFVVYYLHLVFGCFSPICPGPSLGIWCTARRRWCTSACTAEATRRALALRSRGFRLRGRRTQTASAWQKQKSKALK